MHINKAETYMKALSCTGMIKKGMILQQNVKEMSMYSVVIQLCCLSLVTALQRCSG